MKTRYESLYELCLPDCVKVWALAVTRDDKRVITAAADSVVTIWEDSTELEKAQAAEEKEKAHETFVHVFANVA